MSLASRVRRRHLRRRLILTRQPAHAGQALILTALLGLSLLIAIGLAIDGGLLLIARRELQIAADAAAHAGAQEIDVAAYRSQFIVQLDPPRAAAAARATLASAHLVGADVSATSTQVTVRAYGQVTLTLLRLTRMLPDQIEIAADAIASPRWNLP